MKNYGWSLEWEEKFRAAFPDELSGALRPGRILFAGKGLYRLATEKGEGLGRAAGALEYRAAGPEDLPAVGDWAAVETGGGPADTFRIHGILPRKSAVIRNAAGRETERQVLAANVDIVLVMLSLEGGRKCSPRAAERYAVTAYESGARPVFLLNKSDIAEDLAEAEETIRAAVPAADVIAMSCETLLGTEEAAAAVRPGETAVLLGPSGVGKSTFINLLLGTERQKTRGVRRGDMKGRHTTTSRELFLLPSGGMVIDTPGLRELQVWAGDGALEDAFSDIAALATGCRFRDCTHSGEPGCAVLAALERGDINANRYENYRKLAAEIDYLARKTDEKAQAEHERKWKNISKLVKGFSKEKRTGG